jgi:FKBP-type peptidyl-prolyl cis-trans isomerase
LNESGTKRYSDLEVEILIDEISEAAFEAIEQAAGEAAKAAMLESLEKEAAAYREAAHQQAEAAQWKSKAEIAKKTGVKTALITGVICLLSGFATGIIIMGGGK